MSHAGLARYLRLQAARIDEQSLAKIAVNRRLSLRLRQQPQAVEVVALDAAEVILRLRVDHAEHRIGVGFAVDMRDAPVIADDADIFRMLPPARILTGVRFRRRGRAQGA